MRRVYNLYFYILYPIIMLRYRLRCVGWEKIPDGAAVVCANHSSLADPLIMAIAFRRKHYLHFMAKRELAKIPGFRFIFEKAGSFFVERGASDIVAVKTMMRYLKDNEKVMLFPEGTRVSEDDAVTAKNGAVRIAVKTGVPMLPVYIPRKKPLLKKTVVVVGEPYHILPPEDKKQAAGYYNNASDELMKRINSLKEQSI